MRYETYTNEKGESVTFEVARDGQVLEADPNDLNIPENIPYHWED